MAKTVEPFSPKYKQRQPSSNRTFDKYIRKYNVPTYYPKSGALKVTSVRVLIFGVDKVLDSLLRTLTKLNKQTKHDPLQKKISTMINSYPFSKQVFFLQGGISLKPKV